MLPPLAAARARRRAGYLDGVRVPVANVWEAPNAGHLPLDPHVWPTPAVTYAQRHRARRPHADAGALRRARARARAPRRLDARRRPRPAVAARRARLSGLGALVAARRAAASTGRSRARDRARPPGSRNGTEVGLGSRGAGRRRSRAPATRSAAAHAGRPGPHRRGSSSGCTTSGAACRRGATTARASPGPSTACTAITIPRDADAQFAAGTPVPLAKILPGDLLFYEHPVVGHVAMYVGGGQMIESPNSPSEVRIVPVRTSDFRGARRFL